MPIVKNGNFIGRLMRGTTEIGFRFKGTTQIWAREIVVVLAASSAALYMATLFNPTHWDGNVPKRVVVPAGVERGAAGSWVIAVVNGTQAQSFGGTLTLQVDGVLSGIGGAINSGAGGDVIWANQPGKTGQKLILKGTGTIRGGGGGGGKGGNGGGGTYQDPYNHREPSNGFYIDQSPNHATYEWYTGFGDNNVRIAWGGAPPYIIAYISQDSTSYNHSDGWTYLRGPLHVSISIFQIARQQTRYNTVNTSGGVAGNAGRGQGFDGAATNGANAVAGGINAGASGKSGNGGAYGASGQAGLNGANGNVSNGTAGVAAGLAGRYIISAANAILTGFTGTLQGRLG